MEANQTPDITVPDIPKRNLFYCGTLFCLFNIILMMKTCQKEVPSDLVLTDATDFSEIIPVLEESGLFENVFYIEYRDKLESYMNSSEETKLYYAQHPCEFVPEIPGLQPFTDLWTNNLFTMQKLYYYSFVQSGIVPDVHFYDEGNGSYVLNFQSNETDIFNHDGYGDASLKKHLKSLWVYDPELYAGGEELELHCLDSSVFTDPDFVDIVKKLFKPEPLPQQKYIFFEGPTYQDNHYLNDVEMLEDFAEIVGKENIVIKLHPRSEINRFEPFGFQLMDNCRGLWEAVLLANDVTDKVFVTFYSSSVFSAFKLDGKNIPVIMLYKMAYGFYPFYQINGQDIIYNIYSFYNKKRGSVYVPQNTQELKAAIKFIETGRILEEGM